MSEPSSTALLERYLALRATTLRPSSIVTFRSSVSSLLDFLDQRYPRVHSPSQLRRNPHIEQWLQSLLQQKHPLQCATRRKYVLQTRRFLREIWQWQWTHAPTHLLLKASDAPPMPRYLPKPLSPSIDTQLQQALQARTDLASQGLLLARWTGLRVGELVRLERNALSPEVRPCASLRVPLGKLRNQRVIPVDAPTALLIDRILEQTRTRPLWHDPTGSNPIALLLCRPDGSPLRINLLQVRLRQIARAAGIQERVHPHRLRHSYATEMLRLGVPIPAVMKLLGHKSVRMTLRYTEVTQEDLSRYYNEAIAKARSTALLPAPQIVSLPSRSPLGHEPARDLFEQLIAAVQRLRLEESNPPSKARLQRVVESLRRAKQRTFITP